MTDSKNTTTQCGFPPWHVLKAPPILARRPRRSKNGTPEERAAKKAANNANVVESELTDYRPLSSDLVAACW